MRAPNLATAFYAPGNVPDDPALLPVFLRNELDKIAAVISLVAAGHIDKTNVAPTKPRDGDLRYADGTAWNPGSGAGLYYYKAGTWKFIS